ncbi:hypothetical protein AB0E27_09455 [Streptomyces sparsogenes]|uniref:hypothetical protein n=1 Tax=Streptomyces sparsogenes TaxID=67365 RepID=UPI003403189F
MSLTRMEGHACKTAGGLAEHTFVFAPENGRYFDCWGGHDGSRIRLICTNSGNYAAADCYRYPMSTPMGMLPDTAHIGMYAVDGVCHQSANCFLYSSHAMLNNDVSGYWLSCLSYGPYGKKFNWWQQNVYLPCIRAIPAVEPVAAATHDSPEWTLMQRIRAIHGAARDPYEALLEEGAAVTKYFAPEVDTDRIRGPQSDYLQELDAIIASGLVGEPLADRINDLGRQFQRNLAVCLGADQYERLNGVPAEVQVDLIEPDLRRAAGQRNQ